MLALAAVVAMLQPPSPAVGARPESRTVSGIALAPTRVPGRWEGNGLAGDADGIAWYVGEVTLAEADLQGDLVLRAGRMDDEDQAWFNGTKVGESAGWNVDRAYAVPRALLRAGVNRVAVRVRDSGGDGGDRKSVV